MKRFAQNSILALLGLLALLAGCYDLTMATPKAVEEDTASDGDIDTESDSGADADADVDGDSDVDVDGDSDSDADSDSDSDTDTDMDTDADTDTAEGCDGEMVGGYCWYLGASNQSCEAVCQDHNGYDEATKTYAGSEGTDENCLAVMEALGNAHISVYESIFAQNLGCYWDASFTLIYRDIGSETTAAGAQAASQRACACNN